MVKLFDFKNFGIQCLVNRFGMPRNIMVHTGHAEALGHYGCFPGHSGHFGGSQAMITQTFLNSQNSVFCRTSEAHMDMKDSKSRLILTCSKLKISDLKGSLV
jgi:hypothetical protein